MIEASSSVSGTLVAESVPDSAKNSLQSGTPTDLKGLFCTSLSSSRLHLLPEYRFFIKIMIPPSQFQCCLNYNGKTSWSCRRSIQRCLHPSIGICGVRSQRNPEVVGIVGLQIPYLFWKLGYTTAVDCWYCVSSFGLEFLLRINCHLHYFLHTHLLPR